MAAVLTQRSDWRDSLREESTAPARVMPAGKAAPSAVADIRQERSAEERLL
jgi:hypothetical protein